MKGDLMSVRIDFSSIMGNIEIIQRRRRSRSPIFTGRSSRIRPKVPLKTVLASCNFQSRSVSPIRYDYSKMKESTKNVKQTSTFPDILKDNQEDIDKPAIAQQSSSRSPPYIIGSATYERGINKIKCEDIIKKVRNFNDFLNEIKARLRENSEEEKATTFKENQLTKKNSKQLCFNFKLENERLELEKYRKLVERELSKNHSIENITIQSSAKGEKILKIQYEMIKDTARKRYQHSQMPSDLSEKGTNFTSTQVEQVFKQWSPDVNLVSTIEKPSLASAPTIEKAKQLHGLMTNNIVQIGKLIEEEHCLDGCETVRMTQCIFKQHKITHLDALLKRIEAVSRQSEAHEKKIKSLLRIH